MIKIYRRFVLWCRSFINKIYIYEFSSNINHQSSLVHEDVSFKIIRSIDEFEKITKRFNFCEEIDYKRFANSYLAVLYNDIDIICSGWAITQGKFYISEIRKWIEVSNNQVVLYDFKTNRKYRKKGYYKLLLYYFKITNYNKILIIYALSNNYASIAGITKSGFSYLYSRTRYSKSVLFSEKIKEIS